MAPNLRRARIGARQCSRQTLGCAHQLCRSVGCVRGPCYGDSLPEPEHIFGRVGVHFEDGPLAGSPASPTCFTALDTTSTRSLAALQPSPTVSPSCFGRVFEFAGGAEVVAENIELGDDMGRRCPLNPGRMAWRPSREGGHCRRRCTRSKALGPHAMAPPVADKSGHPKQTLRSTRRAPSRWPAPRSSSR